MKPIFFSKKPGIVLALIVAMCMLAGACSGNSPQAPEVSKRTEIRTASVTSPMTISEVANAHAALILSASPEWATQLGVSEDIAGSGFASRLADYSVSANREAYTDLDRMMAELNAFDRSRLSASETITYDVMKFSYDMAQQQNQFRTGLPSVLSASPPYAINQLFGPQIDLPRLLIAQHPVRSMHDAENWLSRLAQVPRVLNELIELTEADARNNVLPPYFALESIATSTRTFSDGLAIEHPIATSFHSKLQNIDTLNDTQRKRLHSKAVRLLDDHVFPAYMEFSTRVAALIPLAGRDAGIWRLNEGDRMYQVALEAWGANGLSANEIHQIGLKDVARIHSQMDTILRSTGYVEGAIGERMALLAKDPRYLIDDTDAAKAVLIDSLQKEVDTVINLASSWFKEVPDYEVEIRRIPVHEQDSSSGGYYTPPPLDGSRPGIFWVNLKSAADVPVYTLKSLVFHEAVPGHHFQAAKSLSITDLPLLQNMMWFGDYGEGWGLYAEELAKEMGLYEGDPLGDLGRYRMELYRAARLVVDTGLHHKRWSREKAIDYMTGVTGESRDSITREIDRYAVWPGQAASYKLGMIQFQRLRAEAERSLGASFDIREFHNVVLREGAMPMAALKTRVHDWIVLKRSEVN